MQIDHVEAGRAFEEALRKASGDVGVPGEWTRRFERLANERTYVAILATGLLARATDARANPKMLKVRAGDEGYNARSLFTNVIFERCLLHGISLGSIGREPHNNQPFFAHAEINEEMLRQVRPAKTSEFQFLIDCLNAASELRQDEALSAFAAFLKTRLAFARPLALALEERYYDLAYLRSELRSFVFRGREGGRRGEAVVAASLDLLFANVHINAKANDPSRHWPGDVVVLADRASIKVTDPSQVLMPVEVKERVATAGEILQFAANLGEVGLHRGAYSALSPQQTPLDRQELGLIAWKRHEVSLEIVVGLDSVVAAGFAFSALPLKKATTKFLQRVAERLEEKQATNGAQEWLELVEKLREGASGDLPLR